MPAQPGEPVLIPALKALVLLPGESTAELAAPASPGVHAERVQFLAGNDVRTSLGLFLGRPVSLASIGRLETVLRIQLGLLGRPFARVYTPPQDITDGTLRIIVQLAALEGDVRVTGATWFARNAYTAAVHARAGEPLDTVALGADLAWLNRNPFRRVTPVIEAGDQPGTTRVTLRAEERVPWSFTTGYSNTGTPLTDEDRVSAGVTWGNAFGRGDLLNLGASGDPSWEHMRSANAGYTAFLPWRQVLTVYGAYSSIASLMPEPFAQTGTSWQVGGRYEIPLRAPRAGWTQNLSFTADFKYSDNTLEFAAIPITGNATHIAEVGATYGVTLPAWGGQNGLSVTLEASPGGLTNRNHDRDFDGSRARAKAEYAYARFNLSHQHPLPAGFSFSTAAEVQFATGALLGTEQLNGAGASAVRGYRENTAFGDEGVVVTNELHAPPFRWAQGRVSADLFAFADVASLTLRHDAESTDLRSAGLGANLLAFRHLSVTFAYGWELKRLDASPLRTHAHLAATLTW